MKQDRIWYPFTQMTDLPNPSFKIFAKGEGNYLIDESGKKYLDGYSSLWVNIHGHNQPTIVQAITDQAKLLDHSTLLGASNRQAIRLASRLAQIVPVENAYIFYSDSGSTSVEIGCKMAYQYWQNIGQPRKTQFLSLENAYHGDTLGMIGLGGIDLFHEVYQPIIKPSLKVTPPYENCSKQVTLAEALEEVKRIFEKEASNIAAMIVEPLIQGAAGILEISKGYLAGIAKLCKEFKVLLVVDEVATGFGRTGKMFACEQEGVKPDIICLAKGISGGALPLAATAVSSEIYDAFLAPYNQFKAFFHGHSYTGNPIACAAANASLDLFESNHVIESLEDKVLHINKKLKELYQLESVLFVRGRGLMVGVEIGKNKTTLENFKIEDRMAHRICMSCIEKGLVLRPLGHVIPIIPPLSIQIKEIDFLFNVLGESILKEVSKVK